MKVFLESRIGRVIRPEVALLHACLRYLVIKPDNSTLFADRALETDAKNEVSALAKAIGMAIPLSNGFKSRLLNRQPKL